MLLTSSLLLDFLSPHNSNLLIILFHKVNNFSWRKDTENMCRGPAQTETKATPACCTGPATCTLKKNHHQTVTMIVSSQSSPVPLPTKKASLKRSRCVESSSFDVTLLVEDTVSIAESISMPTVDSWNIISDTEEDCCEEDQDDMSPPATKRRCTGLRRIQAVHSDLFALGEEWIKTESIFCSTEALFWSGRTNTSSFSFVSSSYYKYYVHKYQSFLKSCAIIHWARAYNLHTAIDMFILPHIWKCGCAADLSSKNCSHNEEVHNTQPFLLKHK